MELLVILLSSKLTPLIWVVEVYTIDEQFQKDFHIRILQKSHRRIESFWKLFLVNSSELSMAVVAARRTLSLVSSLRMP